MFPCHRLPAVLCAVLPSMAAAHAQRDLDPVVVTGTQVPALLGQDPARIVGFAWRNGWQPMPVQVDERAVVPWSQIRRDLTAGAALVYTDPTTWTGADPDPTFDADDELVFMDRDTGGPAGLGLPAGTVAGPVTLRIVDALGGPPRYLHLFVSDGTLNPDAGQDLVRYSFALQAGGTYRQNYNLLGSNPEASVASSARWRAGFSERWVLDDLGITAGSSSGADLLDRDKFQLAPGNCNRTEATFSAGAGAIIANKDGAVRAIRSVVGASGGATTRRDWLLYEGRIDTVTALRMQPISGTFWCFDLGQAASGMNWFDSLNPQGVAVDGRPDTVATGVVAWQLLTGAQGSLTQVFALDTDLPASQLQRGSFYDDDLQPGWAQCTGDPYALGASGPTTGSLPNTDPLRGSASRFVLTRVSYLEAPGRTVADALARDAQARLPLVARALPAPRRFGLACPGTAGPVQLDLAGAAEPGGALTVRAAPLPRDIGAVTLGTSDRTWLGLPLPLDLSPLGLTGCWQHVAISAVIGLVGSNHRAEFGFALPWDPALIGGSLFFQAQSLDPGANPAGLTTSNAVELRIGG